MLATCVPAPAVSLAPPLLRALGSGAHLGPSRTAQPRVTAWEGAGREAQGGTGVALRSWGRLHPGLQPGTRPDRGAAGAFLEVGDGLRCPHPGAAQSRSATETTMRLPLAACEGTRLPPRPGCSCV